MITEQRRNIACLFRRRSCSERQDTRHMIAVSEEFPQFT